MAELNTHRPVSITVAKEKLQIRTDLSDSDLQEVLGLDLGQQLFDVRKMLRQAKVQMDQMDQRLKELSSLLEEGQDSSEAWK